MSTCWRVLTRKKVLDPVSVEETRLSRVLNTFDLTALGVGSTLGVGVYVIAGHVAKDTAGPAVVLSFLIAAVASVFAGLCYAEFGARVPRAGSAYIYSYVCVGEFVAFVIGWNLILEYVIGAASVARGLSLYLDMLLNNTMQKAFIDVAPINVPHLSAYFDFFAFGISVLLAVALAFGLKESSLANNIFTSLNILVVLFVVIAGSFKADFENWKINPNTTNITNSTIVGEGGFFPFGLEGMIKGAATCFYGFVGFDCIATTGEEVKNPRRAIPISIILSLFIIFLAYLGTSTIITLMVPYYLQNPGAPLPYAFEHVGWEWAKWITSIGGIFGQCASLFGAMFPLPRILYAMANDSLVFRFLGKVSPRFQTPVIGTVLAGLLTGTMAAVFELRQLVDMMSLGTFLAYTIVAASVLILRYSNNSNETRRYLPVQTTSDSDDSEIYTDRINLVGSVADSINDDNILSSDNLQSSGVVSQLFNSGRHQNPTKMSETIVRIEVALFCIACVLIALCARFFKDYIVEGNLLTIILTSVVVGIALIIFMSMFMQPRSREDMSFKVPWVPLIPALSIMINIYLMVMLDSMTWIRFAVWMAIGLPTYYFSVRPYTEAHNSNVSDKTSVETQLCGSVKKQNGELASYMNYGFEGDNLITGSNKVMSKKTRAPLPPTRSEEKIDTAEIQQELDKFDEMLDEVANDLIAEHRFSFDSMSLSDVNVSRKENVVAVVHHDNIFPPDEPITPFSLDQHNYEKIDEDEKQNSANVPEVVDNNLVELPESPSLEQNSPDILNKESEVLNVVDPSDTSNLEPTENAEISAVDLESSDENNSIITPPPPPPLPPDGYTPKLPSTPPSSPIIEAHTANMRHSPDFNSQRQKVTSATLQSVTLRRTKRNKKEDASALFVPDDDNLKVGSEKYKVFMANLDEKLKDVRVIPNYIPPVTKKIPDAENITPVERVPNENVIEDKINREDAREKLESFIESLVEKTHDPNPNQTNKSAPSIEEKKETNTHKVTFNEPAEDAISNISNDGNDYMAHKNRMKNVFRSINLKHTDSFKESSVEKKPRNISSWGFATDDKVKHRMAMDDIFKTIELRRNESGRENPNN